MGSLLSEVEEITSDKLYFKKQAALTAGDEVGASISTDFPVLGYMNRSLTIVQLSD